MAKVVYNGTTGQVGGAIHSLTQNHEFEWIGVSNLECDLTDHEAIKQMFEKYQPDYFIQVAAYTAVDKAEDEQALSYAINAESTKLIAQLCKQYKATILYISSDYVYHSVQDQPIKETDPCSPQGIYAKSKYEGEEMIRNILAEHLIMRTSWVYDKDGHNFVNSMIKLGEARDALTIVADQYGAPTYAPDIATAMIKMVEHIDQSTQKDKLYGTYNFSNSGVTHWAGFAEEIFKIKGIDCQVSEITTEQFGAPAPRPKWSVLSTAKFKNAFEMPIRSWQACLRECLSDKK